MPNRTRPQSPSPAVLQGEQRINKVLAAAGLGSRRQVDELIEQGRVEIDGKTITQVGVKVDPETMLIAVDGEPLKRHRPVYFALHKPEGVLCTNRDPQGRPRVVDMVPNQARLFPVGRLDASSTGLILLTNDGELAQRLAHPKHGVPKRYAVVVAGQVEADSLRRLQRGIYLAEGRAKVDHAKLKKLRKGCSEIEITLSEGKNREIRRVLARLGHRVVSLKRIGIGPLKLADMPEGAYRPLSSHEVSALYEAVEELKKIRRQERKARKKLSDSKAKSAAGQPSSAPARDLEDDDDRLPSMALNPYRTDDDSEDQVDTKPYGDDAILVQDHASESDYDPFLDDAPRRQGAVISDDEFEIEADSELEFEEDDDDEFGDDEIDEDERDNSAKVQRPAPRPGRRPAGSARPGKAGPRSGKVQGARKTARSSAPRPARDGVAEGKSAGKSAPTKGKFAGKPRGEGRPAGKKFGGKRTSSKKSGRSASVRGTGTKPTGGRPGAGARGPGKRRGPGGPNRKRS